jgi:hypothetical protein
MRRGCNDCTVGPGRPPFLRDFQGTKRMASCCRFDSPDDGPAGKSFGRLGRAAGFLHFRRLCCDMHSK